MCGDDFVQVAKISAEDCVAMAELVETIVLQHPSRFSLFFALLQCCYVVFFWAEVLQD